MTTFAVGGALFLVDRQTNGRMEAYDDAKNRA
jgi:hypothetical protein